MSEEEFKIQFEKLLKELKDKGFVKSWYYNGQYHWELAEDQKGEIR